MFGGPADADAFAVVIFENFGKKGFVIGPEFVLAGGAVGGFAGGFGVFGVTAEVIEVSNAEFKENFVVVEVVFCKILMIGGDGVAKFVAIGAEDVGEHNEVLVGFGVALGEGGVPDMKVGIGGAGDVKNDEGNDESDDGDG